MFFLPFSHDTNENSPQQFQTLMYFFCPAIHRNKELLLLFVVAASNGTKYAKLSSVELIQSI